MTQKQPDVSVCRSTNPDNIHAQIIACGLFDPSFYQATYVDIIPPGMELLDHYLNIGEKRGLLPSAAFDPLAYKLAHPDVAKSRVSPLAHYARHGINEKRATPTTFNKLLPDLFVRHRPVRQHDDFNIELDWQLNRQHAKNHLKPATIQFNCGTTEFSLNAPPASILIDQIKKNEPFCLIRYPHVFWELLVSLRTTRDKLSATGKYHHLSEDEMTTMVVRFARDIYAEQPRWLQMFSENFLQEVLSDLQAPPTSPNFFRAVDFKGAPTWDERIFATPTNDHIFCQEILHEFSRYFSEKEYIFDATIWKRGVVSGALKTLPKTLAHNPLVVIGPHWTKSLGQRWRHNNFHHHLIPTENTMSIRHNVLKAVSDLVHSIKKTSHARPIVIFQSGASLAAWFITRLHKHHPDSIFFDLGQTLNAWYLDIEQTRPTGCWTNNYGKIIIQNLGLESYYRKFGNHHFHSWLSSLPE